MLPFHACLQPLPAQCSPGGPLTLEGTIVRPLLIEGMRAPPTWLCTFDEVLDALAANSRLYTEPDGSFVWTGNSGTSRWTLSGNLYDQGDRLAYAELSGSCPAEEFDALLRCFGWPETALVFQLPRLGVYLAEADFRRVYLVAAEPPGI